MNFYFTKGQLTKLSELCLDISKGLFLGSFVGPAISNAIDFIHSLSAIFVALTFLLLTLKIEEKKDNL